MNKPQRHLVAPMNDAALAKDAGNGGGVPSRNVAPPAGSRYVFVSRPKCPLCGATKLKTLRTQQQGDGTISRRTLCLACGHRFS